MDNSVRIWSIDSGRCVQVLYNTEESQLTSLTICDNGKVITGTDSGLAKYLLCVTSYPLNFILELQHGHHLFACFCKGST